MSCVIFGAGKIARGFIGHLLYLSNIEFVFVEKSNDLADLINERGEYYVNILGAPEKSCKVQNARALKYSQEEEITEAIAGSEAVFDAVGGKHLGEIVPLLAKGIAKKAKTGGKINFVTCENWKNPAEILREGILKILPDEAKKYFEENVGITEAVIMRSAIEPDRELLKAYPLAVNVQDFWTLPVDASRIKGKLPDIIGLNLIPEFSGFLERKFYTYNAANGTVSYLGALMGYEKIADAAHDKKIIEILDGVYQETAMALSKKHHFPLEEQLAFALTSKKKLQDDTIVDFVERNARDPLRKLGKDDRLVGSANLVLSMGFMPENLSIAIAAALYYYNETDEFAVKLKEMRENEGIDYILENVCEMEKNSTLFQMVKEKISLLKDWGYIE